MTTDTTVNVAALRAKAQALAVVYTEAMRARQLHEINPPVSFAPDEAERLAALLRRVAATLQLVVRGRYVEMIERRTADTFAKSLLLDATVISSSTTADFVARLSFEFDFAARLLLK